MKVLFLYTELADYFVRCCEVLSTSAEVHIVRWPVNPEAPFRFEIPTSIKVYEKPAVLEDLKAIAERIGPDVICCSGWIDKDYLKICRRFKGKVPVVVTLDTSWHGKARQYAALVLSRFFIKPLFSHAWVPGKRQARYARMLGFPRARVCKGFYCCDLPAFNAVYASREGTHAQARRFVYAGRYYGFKGVEELWRAFEDFAKSDEAGWELWCIGTGSIPPAEHPRIRHFGFVQPSDLRKMMKEGGIFILPSRFEPWAVVVQEFAAMGYPLLLSSAVGAAETFLQEGVNGYTFQAGSASSLESEMKKMAALPLKALTLMAAESHRLAQQVTQDNWAGTVHGIFKDWNEKKDPDHRRGG
jgi:glycosyltransferase involved in cell wall biosynthesis